MVGIFDSNSSPTNFGENLSGNRFFNAPASFDKSYKNIFNVQSGSNAEKFLKNMEKRLRVDFSKVEGKIINDARRDASASEMARGVSTQGTYYAKFVEYGYTMRNGTEVPPQRIFGKNRRKMRNILYRNLKNSGSKILSKKEVKKIIDDTMIKSISLLVQDTPRKSGLMSRSWKYIPAE